jgi:hypothetical protein
MRRKAVKTNADAKRTSEKAETNGKATSTISIPVLVETDPVNRDRTVAVRVYPLKIPEIRLTVKTYEWPPTLVAAQQKPNKARDKAARRKRRR